jgi:hypothetical protein
VLRRCLGAAAGAPKPASDATIRGSVITPALFAQLGTLIWIAGLDAPPLVIARWRCGYPLFRKAGFDPPDAFYAAMPGGLLTCCCLAKKREQRCACAVIDPRNAGVDRGDGVAVCVRLFHGVDMVTVGEPFLSVPWTQLLSSCC